MAYLIGLVLALAVAGFGRWSGFDRDRAFYPTVTVVIALYYVLFAVMGGSMQALAAESIGMAVFALAAVIGFRYSPWLVVAALAGHGLFDAGHELLVSNPGVPEWWPAFCMTFDIGFAAVLAALLVRGPRGEAHFPPRGARPQVTL